VLFFQFFATMPKFKGRKTNRGVWDSESMRKAVDKVLSGELKIRTAADRYDIPKSTLHERIKKLQAQKEVCFEPKLGRYQPTFNSNYEDILVEHVRDLSNRLMSLSKKEFLQLAFQLATSLKIPHKFNKMKKIAGKDFYYGFLKRHPDISLRTPESTSLMRGVGFNKPQVDRFFEGLSGLMNKYNFKPSQIYNCDETGITTVQKHSKVLSMKSNRQVGKLTSAERGKNVTVLFCMSASGLFIPPFFIYPRQRINERLKIGAPDESVAEAQPNGWKTAELFLKWMKHFARFSRPTIQAPVLLVLDGHCSHKDLQVVNFARENYIHMLSTPPHTTHKLQPLDRVFMKPLKDSYNEACGLWMRKKCWTKNYGVRNCWFGCISICPSQPYGNCKKRI
jgi:hypothetical protein